MMGAALAAAERFATPLYLYDAAAFGQRFDMLDQLFRGRFSISFAVKSNPNIALMAEIRDRVTTFDASAFAEVERALAAGGEPARITFSGPGKRCEEIERAVAIGVGELVLESLDEARIAARYASERGLRQDVLLRINPMHVPRHFGASMGGRPSQFGVDEEDAAEAIKALAGLDGLRLIGFHIYSGTNSLNPQAIAENFENFIRIFRDAAAVSGRAPDKLIFGSGFGVPYHEGEEPLDIEAVAERVNPMIDALRGDPPFRNTELVLEMGRWLVGPVGQLLTTVIRAKHSRGADIRICDAGFNVHLAACGMMGSIIRRNWKIRNLSRPDGAAKPYTLVGPLCTTIDTLATGLELPEVEPGDVLSVANSGAYGLTASPTRFISHPEPKEVMLKDGTFHDITESALNHWGRNDRGQPVGGDDAT